MPSRPWQFQWPTKANLLTLVELTSSACEFMRFMSTFSSFRPSDVARGCTLVPLTLVWDLSSIPSRYLIDWGVCPENIP